MKASFSKIDITPQLPVRLSGYDAYRIAEKQLESIYARLFYFKGEHELLWIQSDLIGIDNSIVNQLRQMTNINNILFSATHTHSSICGTLDTAKGPLKGLDNIFGEYNKDYVDNLCIKLTKEVERLKQDIQEYNISISKGKIKDIGSNRNTNEYGDEDVLCIQFQNNNKKAMIIRLACHPTVLNATSQLLSQDFFYDIEKEFKDYSVVSIVNGSCGDISTRFTRQGSGVEEKQRLGTLAAIQIKELLKHQFSYKSAELRYYEKNFTLQCRTLESKEHCIKVYNEIKEQIDNSTNINKSEYRLMQSHLEGAKINIQITDILKDISNIELSVSLLKINDQIIIFTPLELFSQLSNPIKKQYNYEFIGYTNGYYLYMPDIKAYDKHYYESYTSLFKKGSGEILMEEIINWADNIKNNH